MERPLFYNLSFLFLSARQILGIHTAFRKLDRLRRIIQKMSFHFRSRDHSSDTGDVKLGRISSRTIARQKIIAGIVYARAMALFTGHRINRLRRLDDGEMNALRNFIMKDPTSTTTTIFLESGQPIFSD